MSAREGRHSFTLRSCVDVAPHVGVRAIEFVGNTQKLDEVACILAWPSPSVAGGSSIDRGRPCACSSRRVSRERPPKPRPATLVQLGESKRERRLDALTAYSSQADQCEW
jgi:hypothetical protein